jgi:hypothetical protein
MPRSTPSILIVSTQNWLAPTRMALRLSRYGCQVSALCPASSELRFFEHLHGFHAFHPSDPLRSLKTAIGLSRADYLIPGDDFSVWLLHELFERSPEHCGLIARSLGPSSSFPTVRSRYGLLSLARSLGVDVPETVVVKNPEEARAWIQGQRQSQDQNHGQPFVLKKDGTWGGGGVQIVGDAAPIDDHYARLYAQPAPLDRLMYRLRAGRPITLPGSTLPDAEVSAQAYVEGTAANAMFACDKGRILGTVQARVVAAKGKTGPALMIDLFDDPRIERAGRLLAQALQLSGFFGLDFILDKDTGVPMLIEMNPRCTQLGHIARSNQTDLAGLLWAQWSGRPIPTVHHGELATSVRFYNPTNTWEPASGLPTQARLDVCPQDRAVVDRLAQGNPAALGRTCQAARAQLKKLKRSLFASRPTPVHYFRPQNSFAPDYRNVRTS